MFGLKINTNHWFRPAVQCYWYTIWFDKKKMVLLYGSRFPKFGSTYEILRWPSKNNGAIRYDDYRVTTSPLRTIDWLKYSLTHLKCDILLFSWFSGRLHSWCNYGLAFKMVIHSQGKYKLRFNSSCQKNQQVIKSDLNCRKIFDLFQ